MKPSGWLSVLFFMTLGSACVGSRPAVQQPTSPTGAAVEEAAPPTAPAPASFCTGVQADLSRDADTRAAPYGIGEHLAKNFSDGKVSWLMKDSAYQSYVVKTGATKWGRCNDTGCYVFVAPAGVIHAAVEQSMKDGKHDAATIGKALGLPAANFEGPLRLMTLDVDDVAACVRLPVDTDPGAWPCKLPEDKDCFKFGGYTSGGVPEAMVIDAPVGKTAIEDVN
jgi:hypothetical protein